MDGFSTWQECKKCFSRPRLYPLGQSSKENFCLFFTFLKGSSESLMQVYEWKLPLTAYTDYVIYDFSFGAYYFGISNYLNYKAVAYFDEVKIYVGEKK